MAQKEAEIHRRVAEMSGLVINEGKAFAVDKDVLGTVVPVTKSFFRAQEPVDDRLDPEGQVGVALLNPTIERIDAELYENAVIAKRLHARSVARRRLMDPTEIGRASW